MYKEGRSVLGTSKLTNESRKVNMTAQFNIQLVYRATLLFTLASKSLLFRTKHEFFKFKINTFLTIMSINILVGTLQNRDSNLDLFCP